MQASATNYEAIEYYRERFGIRRAVLPRVLSLAQVEHTPWQFGDSPAKAVRWEPLPDGMRTRLNGFLIDEFHGDERPGYPTLCKGRFAVDGATYYALEEPTSLNTLDLLPDLLRIGVAAIKIEGRQRSPAYVAQVTRVWRDAIDRCAATPQARAATPAAHAELDRLSEGQSQTLGAYSRPWR